ncbi:MAG: fasciclin domain-containing protein, partial [Chloroflexi bacterium]|nr:fasciclin domain-containing protein [Chloroflexota bacterium]
DLLTEILLYHVVPGAVTADTVVTLDSATTLQGSDVQIDIVNGGVQLNGTSHVIITDIMASNGVIHVIDSVLFPPYNILGLANANGYSIFLDALEAANLTDALLGDGPFTVFVPTNAAFVAALNALGITADELFADTELLTSILLYHVVSGAVTSDVVVTLSSAPTLNGASVSIDGSDGVALNNGQANVIVPDLVVSNGVIHVIDGVLLPPAN